MAVGRAHEAMVELDDRLGGLLEECVERTQSFRMFALDRNIGSTIFIGGSLLLAILDRKDVGRRFLQGRHQIVRVSHRSMRMDLSRSHRRLPNGCVGHVRREGRHVDHARLHPL